MQRNFSDIVADIDFLAHGLSYTAAGDSAPGRQRRTEAAGKQIGMLPGLAQIGVTHESFYDAGAGKAETRAAWLRRQQDLIDSLAAEIARYALESCRALQLADASENVRAFCEFQDSDLRKLVAEVTRRKEQLHHRLEQDRARLGFGTVECPAAIESERQGEALSGPGEISENSLDHGDAEMF